MRAWPVLLLPTLLAIGCQSATPRSGSQIMVDLPPTALVSLPRLAEQLDMSYHPGDGPILELSAPPDRVMLVPESRRAVVNGETLALDAPCMRRGEEYVLTEHDARRVEQALGRLRAARSAPRPVPGIASRRTPTHRSLLPADWRPQADVRDWRHIVVHHMAADSGNEAVIDRMHRARGMDCCGYHFVIGNGSLSGDGEIEVCPRWTEQIHGAHARVRANDDNYWNLHSIGICLVGDFRSHGPTGLQMDALVELVRALCLEYGIPAERVVQHAHVKATLCPGPAFPWGEFQARIR